MSSRPLAQLFQRLDQQLSQLRPYWQLRPFALTTLPWGEQPALQQWLQQLDLDACAELERDSVLRARYLEPHIPGATALHALCQLAPGSHAATAAPARAEPTPARLSYHIPGRKWAQIQAFDRALTPRGTQLLEWCAGKGHLGRLLAHNHRRAVTSLEWQGALCAEGQRLADSLQLPCTLQQQDVLAAGVASLLHPEQHAVALHACGKLHLRLLTLASERQLSGITLSPCCYHLIDEDEYQPLSAAAQRSPLRLSKQDLKLALQDTVTAGARERRLRQRELAWRLGFDLLQRELRGQDDYLPCPTLPKSQLNGEFRTFCQRMAAAKQLALPAGLAVERYEALGTARVLTVTRIELVRNLFRRPLELWLALDRALFLAEHGYEVTLSEFCDYRLTPRNLLIQALRPDAPASPPVAAR